MLQSKTIATFENLSETGDIVKNFKEQTWPALGSIDNLWETKRKIM